MSELLGPGLEYTRVCECLRKGQQYEALVQVLSPRLLAWMQCEGEEVWHEVQVRGRRGGRGPVVWHEVQVRGGRGGEDKKGSHGGELVTSQAERRHVEGFSHGVREGCPGLSRVFHLHWRLHLMPTCLRVSI